MEILGDVRSSRPYTAGNEKLHDARSQPSAAPLSRQISSGPTKPIEERESVHAAWQSRFGVRQLSLKRDDPEPFSAERRLGGGGFGIVHQTSLGGIPLALKRTYPRKLSNEHLNEIRILGKISEQRHHHIVELVGWYVHRQRIGYELGLLIWPVAQCDLAALLHDLSTLLDWRSDGDTNAAFDPVNEDVSSALETLSAILDIHVTQISESSILNVISRAKGRLMQTCGCIAEAIAYLHSQSIRHKDLKPSQILLSPKGLWLADFGWSNDMSDFSGSATSGWDRTTAKYQAPERAIRNPCGRSEDIFALGCMFFEISAYVAEAPPPSPIDPWLQEGWSFQANLLEVYLILDARRWTSPDPRTAFDQLLLQMLAKTPNRRPTIGDVLRLLSGPTFEYSPNTLPTNPYFGLCCQRSTQTSNANNAGQHVEFNNLYDSQITSGAIEDLSHHPNVQTGYRSGNLRTGWGCGYCSYFDTNWDQRLHHILHHIDYQRRTVESWNSSVVIISLLNQPIIRVEWIKILGSVKRVFDGFRWKSSSLSAVERKARSHEWLLSRSAEEPIEDDVSMCLQDALEFFTPHDNAAALAQRAYDEAVKDFAD